MTLRVLAAACAAVALVLAVWSAAWGWAELAMAGPRLSLGAWEEGRRLSTPGRWAAEVRRAARARAVNPLRADYAADLARLYAWQAWQQAPRPAVARASREAAARLFGEALGRRPGWGFAWAQFAESRLLAGAPRAGALQALGRAARLAPWEPDVQRKVIWLGLALWEALPPALQAEVTGTVRRALRIDNRVDVIVGLARQYGWSEHLAPLLAGARGEARR